MKASSPIITLSFNVKNPVELIGGLYNGQVVYWDLRDRDKSEKNILTPIVSEMKESHHDPVYSAKWIHSKAGSEYMTISTDGRLMMWEKVPGIDKGFTIKRKVEFNVCDYNLVSKAEKASELGEDAKKLYGLTTLEVNPEMPNK